MLIRLKNANTLAFCDITKSTNSEKLFQLFALNISSKIFTHSIKLCKKKEGNLFFLDMSPLKKRKDSIHVAG